MKEETSQYNFQLGKRIAGLRETAGHTQEHLASVIGKSTSHIAAIETGRYSPHPEKIGMIAELYQVTADYIITGKRQFSTLRIQAKCQGLEKRVLLLSDENLRLKKMVDKLLGS